MLRLHKEIELRAWRLVVNHRISIDHYYAIVESSNINFSMWLNNDIA